MSINTLMVNNDRTKAKVVPFKVGDVVLVKQNPRAINKLESKFRCPCIVTRVDDNDRYNIKVHDTGNELYVSHDNLHLVNSEMGGELADWLEAN